MARDDRDMEYELVDRVVDSMSMLKKEERQALYDIIERRAIAKGIDEGQV